MWRISVIPDARLPIVGLQIHMRSELTASQAPLQPIDQPLFIKMYQRHNISKFFPRHVPCVTLITGMGSYQRERPS